MQPNISDMVTVIIIVIAFVLYVGFCYYKGQETEEMETVDDEKDLQSESEQELGSVPTRVLVIRTLRNIGCEPLINNSGNKHFQTIGNSVCMPSDKTLHMLS